MTGIHGEQHIGFIVKVGFYYSADLKPIMTNYVIQNKNKTVIAKNAIVSAQANSTYGFIA
jgi:hypothetical protein